MSGLPYLPIEYSRLGPVDLAFVSDDNVIPFGLGPCSKAIQIYGRHEGQCWGSFESQWLNQKDSSASCVFEQNLTHIGAHYTQPRSNNVYVSSGLKPVQASNRSSHSSCAAPQPYSGLTSSKY